MSVTAAPGSGVAPVRELVMMIDKFVSPMAARPASIAVRSVARMLVSFLVLYRVEIDRAAFRIFSTPAATCSFAMSPR